MSSLYKIILLIFFSITPSVSMAAINDGLVGHWSMDGKRTNWTTNTVSNSVSGGNSALMTNIPTSTASTVGVIGQGLNLTNGNDYLTVSNYSAINPTSQITISLWVKRFSNATSREFIINKGTCGNTATCQFYMEFPSDNTVTFYLTEGVNDRTLNSVATIGSLNTWHHVVGTYDGTTQKIFFDGVLINQNNWSGTLQTLSADMVIGYLSSGTFYLNGSIDDVKIYNRALSEREVSQLYKSDKSKTSTSPTKSIKSGLIGYYTMDGKDMNYSSLTATDRGSNKLTGTLVNVNTESSVIGKIGSALRTGATASAQYVSISEAVDDSITSQWSASVWVYRKSASDGTIVRNDEGNGTRGFLIDIFSNNPRSYAYVNGVNVATGVTTLSTGKWYHLVGVCDGTTVKIYLDGVQDGSANIGTAGNIGLSSTPLYIGYGNFANSNFDGYIDDVRIYNRALSLGEIKTLYKLGQNKDAVSPTKSLTSDLVGYWTLDGNKTNWVTGTTQDSSVNGNSGILRRLSTTTSPVPGKIGQALKFNDANTYVDLGTPSALNSLQVPMTITGWFKQLSSSPSLQTIFGQYNNTSGHKLLKLIRLDSGVLKYYGSTAAGSFQSFGTFTPSINTWHFFAVTVVSGSVSPVVKIYLDSSSESTTFAALSSTPDTTVATYIGANESAPNNEMFSGIIDDIRVYNRALSDSEINQLKSLGVSIRR